ncbi:hypothetical protein [Halobacillus sp. A5]|uniref:hypothetical protein n=1 Tax=Halobacillus sp. A5 TaxID=2880263 RepID=UPI0020A6AEC8|nr:hypothetical protein [Halobacillus sp. A5]MCP3028491.1 hypothetical protein [Halobacillus sp. A5]
MEQCVYFSDQFFSAGKTDIYNDAQELVGQLDLKSAFTSSLNVENEKGDVIIEGGFPFFSRKWNVTNAEGKVLGRVKDSFSFFTKRYSYTTDSETYEIESPAFSKEYTILNEQKTEAATFKKVSGFFQSAAYELRNSSSSLQTEELIAVVMGVNAIEKRNSSNAGNAGGGAT